MITVCLSLGRLGRMVPASHWPPWYCRGGSCSWVAVGDAVCPQLCKPVLFLWEVESMVSLDHGDPSSRTGIRAVSCLQHIMRRCHRAGTNGDAAPDTHPTLETYDSAPVRVLMMKPLVDDGEAGVGSLPDIKEARASMEGWRSINTR